MNPDTLDVPLGVECAWPMFLELPLARVTASREEAEDVLRRLLSKLQEKKSSRRAK